ncbi:cytidine deaminase-like protein, partial [Umbelopsis sp. PMI_123]
MTSYTNDPKDLTLMKMAIAQANISKPVESAYCVGAVLVAATGEILSTGYSRELPGNTHAEQCALDKLSDLSLAENAVCYTTMEPCSKRLSGNKPCVERLIEAKVKKVIMGIKEPPNFVECSGVDLLQQAGIEVFVVPGVEEECLK